MGGLLNGNQLTIVKEYQFDKPLIQKIDCLNDDCIRDCYNKYFHTFDHKCVYENFLTNITKNEIIIITISGKSMNLYELKNLPFARQRGFIFNQGNKLTMKICSNLSCMNKQY